jgi:hypothetical protein
VAGSGRHRRGCCRIASPGWRLARRQLDRGVEARGADEVIRHLAVPGLRAADHSLGSRAAFTYIPTRLVLPRPYYALPVR